MNRRRRISRAVIALILMMTIVMVMPQRASADPQAAGSNGAAGNKSAALEEIAEQLADPSDPFDYTREADRMAALKAADKELPAKFDLRDVNGVSYVTPVKFQNPWGNCWGFAAIAAAETSILGDDELRGNYTADTRKEDPASGKIQMDLSEKHLSYFAATPINDPDNPQNGEGETLEEDLSADPVAAAYDLGGFAPTATSFFAAGIGPVLESEDPLFEYRGKNGIIDKQWVNGAFVKYCYSDTDDWSIDEDLRFRNSFTLSESFLLPCPAVRTSDGVEDDYRFEPAGVAAIKEQLLKRRGVEIAYKEDTFIPESGETHGDYINSNYAHYTYDIVEPSHAVCIVGWDDTYSKDNFRHDVDDEDHTAADTVPQADGAWLVKNSWGSGEEEFPDKGDGSWGIRVQKKTETGETAVDGNGDPVMTGSGYFWLSYYDKSIGNPEALDFEDNAKGTKSYTNVIDQHDFLRIKEYRAAHVKEEVKTANIFTAKVCEELRKVSCETTYPGTEVTFDVYLLANEHQSPVDGILMDSVSATFEYGGLHKVSLTEPFIVMRGQSYAIVVTQKVPVDGGGREYAVAIQSGTGKAVVNKGESFLFADGKWQDLSDETLRENLLDNSEGVMGSTVVDNFPIKGYGEERPDVTIALGHSGSFDLPGFDPWGKEGIPEVHYLMWIIDNTGSDDQSIADPVWKVSDGGLDVIKITDGRDITRKTVSCKKLGWTYLSVSVDGIGTAISRIQVTQPAIQLKAVTGSNGSVIAKHNEISYGGVDGFELAYRIKGEETWSVREYGPEAEEFELTGLSNGRTYEIKARSFVDTKYGRYYSEYGVEETVKAGGAASAEKAKNTMNAYGRKVSVSYAKVKKKKLSIARARAITVSGAKGDLSYRKISVSCSRKLKKSAKKIKVDPKSGRITLKKGLKKGTYKVKVEVRAAGGGGYEPGVRTVTLTIRVK